MRGETVPLQQTIRIGAAVLEAKDVRGPTEITVEGDRIASIGPCSQMTEDERATVATAGLVNAHAHLDLGAFEGLTEPGPDFKGWIRALMAARAGATAAELERGARRSADALLATGTTAVIDIDSTGIAQAALEDHPLRILHLAEIIDGSPAEMTERSEEALERAERALDAAPSMRRAFGVSPHAPHTLSDDLLTGLGLLTARAPNDRSRSPVAIHWAETEQENEWLTRGSGPFAPLLGPSPGVSGSERLDRAGLLAGSLLVHGNVPLPGEIERLRDSRPAPAIVHCPGCHAYFERPRFSAEPLADAELDILLGTDSIASNLALDMRREVALARSSLGWSAAKAWTAATEAPAARLPWRHVTGRLEVGGAADLVVFEQRQPGRSALEIVAACNQDLPPVRGVMVAGAWAIPPPR